jgi:biopolymer transport protein ExbD
MHEIYLNSVRSKKARVEIIPLIDVVFFLLATFVLFVLSLEKLGVLDTTLPVAGGPQPAAEDQTLYLASSVDGFYLWREGRLAPMETISTAELGPRLADYRRRIKTPHVMVGGDSKAKFGSTVKALDEVRKAEIKQVAIGTLTTEFGF